MKNLILCKSAGARGCWSAEKWPRLPGPVDTPIKSCIHQGKDNNWKHSLYLLVDHPTQLICIWIFICWVGGGDPCGVADFCISGPCGQKKQAGSDFFEKYPCHVHIVREEAKNRTKNGQKPSKKGVFISTSDHLSNFWRQQLLRPATFRASNFYWLAQNWWTNRSPPPSHDSDWYQQMALIANSIDGRFASYRSYCRCRKFH